MDDGGEAMLELAEKPHVARTSANDGSCGLGGAEGAASSSVGVILGGCSLVTVSRVALCVVLRGRNAGGLSRSMKCLNP